VQATLDKIKQMAIGTRVKVKGIVAVEPGILGKNIMYLKGSGVQIYLNKLPWTNFELGQEVELTGTISQINGEKRIKLAKADDLQIIDPAKQKVSAKQIAIEEIDDPLVGYLAQVSGVILDKKASKIYLDDGTGEAMVYIKASTNIDLAEIFPGDELQVTGILSKYPNEIRILPRYEHDLVVKKSQQNTQPTREKPAVQAWKYAILAVIFLGGLVTYAIYWWKTRKK